MSELASVCDLVIPMETPNIGCKAFFNASRYKDSNYFQKSALYALGIDNMVNNVYRGRFEVKDLV